MTFIREIKFKAGEDEAAQRCCDMLDNLQQVLGTTTRDGCRHIVANFEDEIDFLAFLTAIGAAKVIVVGEKTKALLESEI